MSDRCIWGGGQHHLCLGAACSRECGVKPQHDGMHLRGVKQHGVKPQLDGMHLHGIKQQGVKPQHDGVHLRGIKQQGVKLQQIGALLRGTKQHGVAQQWLAESNSMHVVAQYGGMQNLVAWCSTAQQYAPARTVGWHVVSDESMVQHSRMAYGVKKDGVA
eukprot:1160739-Pelagomonas_calceolata.AAC.15